MITSFEPTAKTFASQLISVIIRPRRQTKSGRMYRNNLSMYPWRVPAQMLKINALLGFVSCFFTFLPVLDIVSGARF